MEQVYYLAARYQEDSVSKGVYMQTQELIRDNECELSAYRYLANTLEKPWHVVVIGNKPPGELHQRFVTALSGGTATTIDPKVLAALMERRRREIQQGDWREHHASITMKKKKQSPKNDMIGGTEADSRALIRVVQVKMPE